ncbi:MAG: hypothetical protein WCH05_05450 [Chlorobiaceae bacterium]|jgi:hypothetical protein
MEDMNTDNTDQNTEPISIENTDIPAVRAMLKELQEMIKREEDKTTDKLKKDPDKLNP